MNTARTIKALTSTWKNDKVYVRLKNDEIGKTFMQQAEDEGFTFGDGVKPTERHYSEIMAVNDDNTISYVNSIGRIAYGSGTSFVAGKKLIRVDFEKYLKNQKRNKELFNMTFEFNRNELYLLKMAVASYGKRTVETMMACSDAGDWEMHNKLIQLDDNLTDLFAKLEKGRDETETDETKADYVDYISK